MVETEQMPTGIHSSIPIDAVGEALLQHYNVGIPNPWAAIGISDQETYNRRKLPWAGKSFTVDSDGNVIGETPRGVSEDMEEVWGNLATTMDDMAEGEGEYGDLKTLHEELLTEVGDELRGSGPQQ